MYDTAQWFEGVGECRCGKKATGILRGTRNESLGPYCQRCMANAGGGGHLGSGGASGNEP
jgi:hypothetical protein